jgi:ABC-type molybdenum transport system ATPase subunit/photorepair protein PhrA
MLTENEQNTRLTLEQSTYLGPARVHRVAGSRIQLEFPDELPWAMLALAYPYQPTVGDTVLAAGQGQNWYVIGVLQGTGKTTLMVPGDFEVLAPKGHINLIAGKGFQVKSPEVRITAGKLELVAKRISERFLDATHWVKNSWHIRAGRVRTEVEGNYQVKAKRIIERAEEDVRIDGEKIHLG